MPEENKHLGLLIREPQEDSGIAEDLANRSGDTHNPTSP